MKIGGIRFQAVTHGQPPPLPPEPLVSIITPVLERADTIGDVLACIAAQTYGSVEHIIVDGGSRDGTVEIVKAFSRSSPSPIRWISESDTGMYDAVNKGFRLAQGDVLAYLNSDDLYFPWSIETAVRALRGGCDFVYGDVAIINKKEKPPRCRLQFYPRFDARYFAYYTHLAQATVFWSRSAMERLGPFDDTLRYLGDVEYWTRAGLAKLKFCHLEEILALVTEHPGTLSSQHADSVDRERALIQQSFAGQLGRPNHMLARKKVESLRWRWRQLTFRAQANRAVPTRWPQFIAMLQGLHIEVSGNGILLFLLPAALFRKRPEVWQWFRSAEDFEVRVVAAIRARAGVEEG